MKRILTCQIRHGCAGAALLAASGVPLPVAAQITDPVPGSTLSGPNVTFTWAPVALAEAYRIGVGSSEGATDYFDSGSVAALSQSVTGLPVDGSTVHVRLWTSLPDTGWTSSDFSFATRDISAVREGEFQLKNVWVGSGIGVPSNLGGLIFSRDGMTLYVVGASETLSSALYAIPVVRDPETNQVVRLLGSTQIADVVFRGDPQTAGLDAGWEFGPEGTLFYTYWSAHFIGQRPGGFEGEETLFDMADIGLPSSVAGLTFSPHLDDTGTGFGRMQVSVWQGANIHDIYLTPVGNGLFRPTRQEVFVTLPRQGTGAIQYIPSGIYEGNLMYVNWDHGEVMMILIDPLTGLPIDDGTGLPTKGTDNPRAVLFATGLGAGPWGLEFDPLTNDFFVATWIGSPSNSIIHFSGSGLPEPSNDLAIQSLERDGAFLTIQWNGPVGWDHVIQISEDLLGWSDHRAVDKAPGFNRLNFQIPDSNKAFFRLRASPPE